MNSYLIGYKLKSIKSKVWNLIKCTIANFYFPRQIENMYIHPKTKIHTLFTHTHIHTRLERGEPHTWYGYTCSHNRNLTNTYIHRHTHSHTNIVTHLHIIHLSSTLK